MIIKSLYKELLVVSLLLNFFDALLSAIAMFSICYFLMFFIRLDFRIAIFLSVLFFLRSIYSKIKENKILLLEKKYPNLKERLRTSYEHQSETNTIVNELHMDILGLMKKVDPNAFFDAKKTTIKVLIILGMLILTLYFSYLGFDTNLIKATIQRSDFGSKFFPLQDLNETREEVKKREKLDKPKLIDLGNKEVNISIDTYNTELNIKEIKEPEKNDFNNKIPEEIGSVAQELYEEKIPEEYKDAVKEYFKKINE
ncbi:MAG: hypothetical protein QW757_02485 [Candidatus Woesearchaeota archaeon]